MWKAIRVMKWLQSERTEHLFSTAGTLKGKKKGHSAVSLLFTRCSEGIDRLISRTWHTTSGRFGLTLNGTSYGFWCLPLWMCFFSRPTSHYDYWPSLFIAFSSSVFHRRLTISLFIARPYNNARFLHRGRCLSPSRKERVKRRRSHRNKKKTGPRGVVLSIWYI